MQVGGSGTRGMGGTIVIGEDDLSELSRRLSFGDVGVSEGIEMRRGEVDGRGRARLLRGIRELRREAVYTYMCSFPGLDVVVDHSFEKHHNNCNSSYRNPKSTRHCLCYLSTISPTLDHAT
jgi:hypothetical protein